MKTFLFLAAFMVVPSFFVDSSALAQPSQQSVFYPPTWHVEKSEVKGNTRTEIIERRQIIVLGFLPRTQSGQTQTKTSLLSSEDRSFRLSSEVKSGDFNGVFAALKTELLGVENLHSKLKIWDSISQGSYGWSLFPVNTLNAAQNYGQMIYCLYTQRYTIVGVREGKTLRFEGILDFSASSTTAFTLTKMRPGNFDFTTLPTPREMGTLDDQLHNR